MIEENDIINADLEYAATVPFIDWSEFHNASFFITGGTGLIGRTIINILNYANSKYDLNLSISVLVRNPGKAEVIFNNSSQIKLIEGCIESIPEISDNFDYIIHTASMTSSRSFSITPVETLENTARGMMNILNLARNKNIKGLIYTSSMEVYGTPSDDTPIDESHLAEIDLSIPRSSYPAGKAFCESLCVSYSYEYKIPVKIVRLTQTFGPGVRYDDQRVFAEFARCAIEGKNIILATKGETRRNYLYTVDAVTAILLVLLKGENGQVYNVANEETYCSIMEMAKLVAEKSSKNISVIIDESYGKNRGFAPVLHMNLNTAKIQSLGWKANYSLEEMFSRMICTMKK